MPNKTQPTKQSASKYLNSLEDPTQKKEGKLLVAAFKRATGAKPVMWGNIVGFGQYHYKYDSGREGDFLATGFALRKSGPTVYIMPGYTDYTPLLEKLGVTYKLGKSCLYFKNLDGLNQSALERLIKAGIKDLSKTYPVDLT